MEPLSRIRAKRGRQNGGLQRAKRGADRGKRSRAVRAVRVQDVAHENSGPPKNGARTRAVLSVFERVSKGKRDFAHRDRRPDPGTAWLQGRSDLQRLFEQGLCAGAGAGLVQAFDSQRFAFQQAQQSQQDDSRAAGRMRARSRRFNRPDLRSCWKKSSRPPSAPAPARRGANALITTYVSRIKTSRTTRFCF